MDTNVGDILLSFIRNGYWDLMDKGNELMFYFKAFYGLLLICSIIIYGIRMMTGDAVATKKEFLKTCLWVLLGSSLLDSQIYNSFLIEPIHTLKNNLAIFMVSGDGTTVFSSIQASFAGLMGFGMSLVDSGSIMTNLMPIVIGGVVMLVSGGYYVTIVANLLLCELTLYLLYFLGIFIIPLGAFSTARPIFNAWARAIAKYALVFIIIGTLVGLIDAVMRLVLQEVLNQSYQNGGYGEGISSIYLGCVITLSCFGAYLMVKAMELAAELTGSTINEGSAGVTSIQNGIKTMSLNGMRGSMRGGSMAAYKKSKALKGQQ
jgi:hypothetical protein